MHDVLPKYLDAGFNFKIGSTAIEDGYTTRMATYQPLCSNIKSHPILSL